MGSPRVRAVYWGSAYGSSSGPTNLAQSLDNFFVSIFPTSYFRFLAEYNVNMPTFFGSVWLPHDPTVPVSITPSTMPSFLTSWLDGGLLPEVPGRTEKDLLYIVFLSPEMAVATTPPGCAFHSWGHYHKGSGKDNLFVAAVGSGGLNSLTGSASHELAEAFTDRSGNGWYSNDTGFEIGDVCSCCSCPTLTLNGFSLSSYWRNSIGDCLQQALLVDDARVFNADFYLHHYPDLLAAFGNDPAAARNHWLTQGLPQEGRRGSRVFDVQFYLSHFADLKNAFGTNFTAAVDHWLNQGLPNEGRRGSREFDVQFYLSRYVDLKNAFGTNFTAAVDHWLNQGLPNEGRAGANEVDVTYYLNNYIDLKTAFGTNYPNAIDHWLSQGLPNEGRRGSLEFDVLYYLATYPDLQAAFGNNYTAAFDHWVTTGILEGRKGAP